METTQVVWSLPPGVEEIARALTESVVQTAPTRKRTIDELFDFRCRAQSRTAQRMEQYELSAYRFPHNRANYKLLRDSFKDLGRSLGHAVRAEDECLICSILNERMSWSKRLRASINISDQLSYNDGVTKCSLSDCSRLEVETNLTDIDDECVCSACLRDKYVHSEEMDEYIPRRGAERYYCNQHAYEHGTFDYITESYGDECSHIEWDSNAGAYLHESVCPRDNDEDNRSDGLAGYHSATRRFVVRSAQPNALYQNMPALGLELEVYSDERRDTVRSLKNDFSPVGKIILERDGSLSEDCGFEIITDPLGHPEWLDMGPRLCEHLLEQGASAYNTRGNYGIHITLERRHLTTLQEARMFLFMIARENREFMKAIAQRNAIYNAETWQMGNVNKSYQRINTIGGVDRYSTGKKLIGVGKYCPINFKDHLAEIRIFQATLCVPSFMKNLEFVWALIEWVRDSSGTSWNHTVFVKWLSARGNARRDYPNLYTYLLRPQYGVKHLDTRIVNTWAPLLATPKPKKGEPYSPLELNDDQLIPA